MGTFFSKYGEIALIRLIDKFVSSVGFGIAYIELMDGRCEEAVIVNSKFGILVFPEKADYTHSTEPKMNSEQRPVPPDPESTSNILNALNDDCLQEIFRYLSLVDLGSVADVCEKFNANAHTIFSLKHSGSTLEIDRNRRNERLVRNFRIDIKSLSIDGWCYGYDNNAELLNLINYFSDPGCQFNRFFIQDFTNNDLKPWKHLLSPIFERLNYLQVEHCYFDGFLGYCRNLKELEVRNSPSMKKITSRSLLTKNVFKNLEKISLDDTYLLFGIKPNTNVPVEWLTPIKLHLLDLEKSHWTILDIVKYGIQLNYLLINDCLTNIVIDDAIFNNILAHVMARERKAKLVIEIRGSEKELKMTVSPNMIKKYSDLLEIRFISNMHVIWIFD